MYIELLELKVLRSNRSEMHWFDLFIYRYIALRWSAEQWLVEKSINIWLLRSQNTVLLYPARHADDRHTERKIHITQRAALGCEKSSQQAIQESDRNVIF